MLFLSALRLAPLPDENVAAWKAARSPPLLGAGVADTAEYTWYLCRLHSSLELAITGLACIQGYYENSCT